MAARVPVIQVHDGNQLLNLRHSATIADQSPACTRALVRRVFACFE